MATDPDFMLSLARGLAVIRAFGDGKPQLSIREIALATGVPPAAACTRSSRSATPAAPTASTN